MTDQPRLVIKYVDTNEAATIIFDKFGGKLGDAYLAAECDDDDCTVEFRQTANFIIQDPAGNAVSAHLKVESGDYSVVYGGAGVDPVVTTTDYSEEQEYSDVENQSVDIPVKVMAIAHLGGGDQTRRNADEESTVVTDDLTPIRYSAWAWGKLIAYRQAFSFDADSGEQDVVVSLSDDNLITSATQAAVPAAAATFDDIYDLLAEYAFENEEEIACTVADGVLEFDDADVVLADGGSLSRASGTVTIPCGSEVVAGTKITGIKATGDLTINSGVTVDGPTEDQSGVVVTVTGLPAGHTAVIAAWPESQGEDARGNIITGGVYFTDLDDVSMTASTRTLATVAGDFSRFEGVAKVEIHGFEEAANNGEFDIDSVAADGLSMVLSRDSGSFVDESAGRTIRVEDGSAMSAKITLDPDVSYYILADAVSYLRAAPIVLDPSATRTLEIRLRRIVNATGDDLIPQTLTADEIGQYDLIDYDHANDTIYFGATTSIQKFSFNAVARRIEIGQSASAAMDNPYVCFFGTGSFSLEAAAERTLQRKSGLATSLVPDLSAFQFRKIGATDQTDFVDFDNGAIIVNTGDPAVVAVTGADETSFHSYLASYEWSETLDQLAAGVFGGAWKGEWSAGAYAVDDVVWYDDQFYACTVARTSSDTDNPATDTGSWEVTKVASGGGSGSLDQTTFNTRMANVPDATKDTYKGSGGSSSYSEANLHSHLDSYGSKDDWKAAVGALTDSAHGLAALKTLIDTVDTVADANKALLEDGTNGLAALKTLLDAIPTSNPSASDIASAVDAPTTAEIVTAIQAADFSSASGVQSLASVLDALSAVVTDNNGHLESATYGLAALKALLDAIPTSSDIATAVEGSQVGTDAAAAKDAVEDGTSGTAAIKALIDTVDTVADSIKSDIEDGTSGLSALKTLIDALPTDTPPTAATIAEAVRDLSVVTGLNLLQALRVLLAIGGGRVEEDPNDDDMLRIYSAIDDDHVITLPKFVGDDRAAGATAP